MQADPFRGLMVLQRNQGTEMRALDIMTGEVITVDEETPLFSEPAASSIYVNCGALASAQKASRAAGRR
jgi:hypothetical protein